MSRLKAYILLIFLFICSFSAFAQKGLYAGIAFNTAYAHNKKHSLPGSSPLQGQYIYSQIENAPAYGFHLRFGFNDNISISAGANYSKRDYTSSILKKAPASVDTIRYNYFDLPVQLNYRILLTEGPTLGIYFLTNAGLTYTKVQESKAVFSGSAQYTPPAGSTFPAYTLTVGSHESFMSFTAGLGLEADLYKYGIIGLGIKFRKPSKGNIDLGIDYQNGNLTTEFYSLGDIGILNVSIRYFYPLAFTNNKKAATAEPKGGD